MIDSLLNIGYMFTLIDNSKYFYILMYSLLFVLIICLLIIIKNYNYRLNRQKKNASSKNSEEDNSELQIQIDALKAENQNLSDKYEELKKTKERLYTIAYNDRLTNLPNRHALTEMIDSTLATLRKDEEFVLVHIDLDNFKIVNDKLGHSYGDELILDVSHRLRDVLEENDFLARYGSDEFIIFSQNISDIEQYDEKLNKIQKSFSFPFLISGREIFVTVSAGVVVAPRDGKTTSLLMRNADLAMFEAKNLGRNTYCYYEDQIGERYAQKLELQSEINRAIQSEEFYVAYQPIVRIEDKNILEYEALIRWNHPTRGELLPDEFLPTAIKTGQIISLGEIVLNKVFEQLAKNKNMKITINLSDREFFGENLSNTISTACKKYNASTNQLLVEVDEEVLVDNIERSIEVIGSLHRMGIDVVVDCFGIKLTSIMKLGKANVNVIKIDKSFLAEAMFDESYRALMEGIIKIADSVGIPSIVMGVEDIAQEEMLKTINCRIGQGYLYGKPGEIV